MRALRLDLNCAVRTLRANPFFTWVAASTLALGIAFNAIVFTVVNSVLLRSLPYPSADRLVIVQGQEQRGGLIGDLTASAFFFIRQHASSLEDVTAIYPSTAGVNITAGGTAKYVRALRVSKDFFHLLQTIPAKGRTFDENEDKTQGPRVAVLSYALWTRTFNQDRLATGAGFRINGDEYTIIGVMPEAFRSYPEADLWLPLQLSPATAEPGSDYRVIARIRTGASSQRAQEELRELSENYPVSNIRAAERVVLGLQSLQDFETHDVRKRLMLLLGAVLFVLLIACANVAMLLLVRASAGSHELAIRSALGSPRNRLIQVLFLESTILAFLGGLLGIILAKELLPLALSFVPPGLPLMVEIHLDWRVVAFTFGLSTFTALLFGMVPAAKLFRLDLNVTLAETTSRATASAGRLRTARLLLVTQSALTVILLSGAILLFQRLLKLEKAGPGFDVHEASVAQVSLASHFYQTSATTNRVLDHIIQELQSLPSVESVASVNGLPLEGGLNMPMHPGDAPERIASGEYRLISESYFKVMRIPMIQGRPFDESDGPGTEPVAIVNETLAHKWWPGTYCPGHLVIVGEELGPEFRDKPRLVVGVAADVHQSSLEQPERPMIFVPTQQAPDRTTKYANKLFLTSIVFRSPRDISERVRTAVESADPNLSVASFRPMSQLIVDYLDRDRFYAFLTVTFGGFSLFITALGIYGLLSYQVRLRARELAIRQAIGGKPSQIVVMVVRQGLQPVAIGVLIGAVGAFFCNRLFASILFDLPGPTLGALGSASLLLLLVAMLAGLLTAYRVAAIEPMIVLRNE